MGRMFEKRKHTMFARYDRMAKQFARIGKDIVIAVKAGGADPDMNPQLRRVMQNAKGVNMPKEKVEAAVKRALGKDTASYDEVLYEGYGPHGVPLLVDAATDNVNRTVANLRAILARGGGNLGTTGSVAFQFTKMGAFTLDPTSVGDRDDLELELIDRASKSWTRRRRRTAATRFWHGARSRTLGRCRRRWRSGASSPSPPRSSTSRHGHRPARRAGRRGAGIGRQDRG